MTCRVDLMDSDTTARWDAYARQSLRATIFHGTPWKQVVESTYGCSGFYLYAHEQDQIQGILPVFLCGSHISGRSLVALPFAATQPSVCADDETAERALIEAACELARENGVQGWNYGRIAKNPGMGRCGRRTSMCSFRSIRIRKWSGGTGLTGRSEVRLPGHRKKVLNAT